MSKHQIQPECGEWAAGLGTRRPNLSRETKVLGANGDWKKTHIYSCLADHEQDWRLYPVNRNSAISGDRTLSARCDSTSSLDPSRSVTSLQLPESLVLKVRPFQRGS